MTAPRPEPVPTVELGRIERKYVHLALTATLHDGTAIDLDEVGVALVPTRSSPGPATDWSPLALTDNRGAILLAGPDATLVPGALTVPADGADLRVLSADSPEVITIRAARIVIT